MKYLGKNNEKCAKDFCIHNYETLIREITENQNKSRDITCLSMKIS